jgi:uncharacterized protein
MKPLVIYHDKCTDGFGAAFAAWMKLGDTAEYVACSYGDATVPDYVERDVYILDFSFKREVMDDILREAKRVVWLDHHKTAFEMWCGPDQTALYKFADSDTGSHIILDNNKSGAYLAWEYFHPGTEVPALIQRIDDRDRWVFQYPNSKALHAGLRAVGQDFKLWKMLTPMGTSDWARNFGDTVSRGYTILSVYDEQIKDRVRVAEKCVISYATDNGAILRAAGGLAVNSPMHQSEIGNELAKASGTYGMVWYYDAATKRANVSLRSIGDYDVSALAKAFGGGGHKNAAGFNIDMPTLLGWLK